MRFLKTTLALLLVFCAFATKAAADVAVVDVTRVITSSAPGKAGQQYVDNLKKALEDELSRFRRKNKKEKDAQARIAQKQAELRREYQAEQSRVANLIMAALRNSVQEWLTENKKGITIVVPAGSALGYEKQADISGDILQKFNAVQIDFTKK